MVYQGQLLVGAFPTIPWHGLRDTNFNDMSMYRYKFILWQVLCSISQSKKCKYHTRNEALVKMNN